MKKERKTGLDHPQTMYYHQKFPMQKQKAPGYHHKMKPIPDSGEETYIGSGRLMRRKALITGGDSGIGRAITIAFAREGAQVSVNYLPEEQKDAENLSNFLKKEDNELILLPNDLRDEKECIRIIKDAAHKMNGLDLLVLNSGVQIAQKDITQLSSDQIYKTFAVNVFSPMFMAKAAIPYLKPGSSIIFTGSAEYYSPNKVLLDYASSKFAIVGFSRALAKQIIDKGIRVNTVCPGPVWTPLEVSRGNTDEMIPKHGLDTPLKRPGQPVELSGIYVFWHQTKLHM